MPAALSRRNRATPPIRFIAACASPLSQTIGGPLANMQGPCAATRTQSSTTRTRLGYIGTLRGAPACSASLGGSSFEAAFGHRTAIFRRVREPRQGLGLFRQDLAERNLIDFCRCRPATVGALVLPTKGSSSLCMERRRLAGRYPELVGTPHRLSRIPSRSGRTLPQVYRNLPSLSLDRPAAVRRAAELGEAREAVQKAAGHDRSS